MEELSLLLLPNGTFPLAKFNAKVSTGVPRGDWKRLWRRLPRVA